MIFISMKEILKKYASLKSLSEILNLRSHSTETSCYIKS